MLTYNPWTRKPPPQNLEVDRNFDPAERPATEGKGFLPALQNFNEFSEQEPNGAGALIETESAASNQPPLKPCAPPHPLPDSA